jgi:hypothetical protein
MGLITGQGWPADEYEAVALPAAPDVSDRSLGSAVFRRRSARPSRRAVLHLHDLTGSFAPSDLVRWYNERGFHFYVTDLDLREPLDAAPRRRQARAQQAAFGALDAACNYLREADGIDAIILSAQESAGLTAAQWCDARRASRPVDALILSRPDFGRSRGSLDIACPVLVIAGPRPAERQDRRARRGRDTVGLGQHVTWLQIDEPPPVTGGTEEAEGAEGAEAAPNPDRRRLFDEMGRWLGAYMYGNVRDQLL